MERTATVDIARAAEVSHGAVFAHFPTRDDLVLAVIDGVTQRIAANLRDLALRCAEPSLRDTLRAHVAAVAAQEGLYAAFVLERRLLPVGARSRFVILLAAVAHYFRLAAARAIARGAVRDRSLTLLFNVWIAMLHHTVCNRDLFAEGDSALAERGDRLIAEYLQLIAPDPRKEHAHD